MCFIYEICIDNSTKDKGEYFSSGECLCRGNLYFFYRFYCKKSWNPAIFGNNVQTKHNVSVLG